MVFANSKKSSDFKQLPKGAKAVRKKDGNTIPMVFVTTADGSKGITAIPYDKLKKDTRKVARNLQKDLESYENILGNAANVDDTIEEPALLAESQDWTNSDGVKITAAVKSIEGGNVIFVMGDKEISYAINKLSAESKQTLKRLQKN